MERVADSWRANVARGGRPRAVTLTDLERDMALAAAAAVGADIAGVDLLVGADGEIVVPEVNGIPGWQALQSVCGRPDRRSSAPARRVTAVRVSVLWSSARMQCLPRFAASQA